MIERIRLLGLTIALVFALSPVTAAAQESLNSAEQDLHPPASHRHLSHMQRSNRPRSRTCGRLQTGVPSHRRSNRTTRIHPRVLSRRQKARVPGLDS